MSAARCCLRAAGLGFLAGLERGARRAVGLHGLLGRLARPRWSICSSRWHAWPCSSPTRWISASCSGEEALRHHRRGRSAGSVGHGRRESGRGGRTTSSRWSGELPHPGRAVIALDRQEVAARPGVATGGGAASGRREPANDWRAARWSAWSAGLESAGGAPAAGRRRSRAGAGRGLPRAEQLCRENPTRAIAARSTAEA